VKRSELMHKMAAGRPLLSDHVRHWGLGTEKRFPLDTPDCVKIAAHEFDSQLDNMTTAQRLECARGICKRAADLSLIVDKSLAHKYAHLQISPHFHGFMDMRKEATAHLADSELDKLIKVADIFASKSDLNDRVKGLDKVAEALETFDRDHDLVGHWGHWFPDPAYTIFGPTMDANENIETVVKVADFEVRRQDLDTADWDRVEGKVPAEVVEGLKMASDRLAVFASLPAPEKEIIYQSLFTGRE